MSYSHGMCDNEWVDDKAIYSTFYIINQHHGTDHRYKRISSNGITP
jgi:hypothetical protein